MPGPQGASPVGSDTGMSLPTRKQNIMLERDLVGIDTTMTHSQVPARQHAARGGVLRCTFVQLAACALFVLHFLCVVTVRYFLGECDVGRRRSSDDAGPGNVRPDPLVLGRMRLQGLLRLPAGYQPVAVLVMEGTVRPQIVTFPGGSPPWQTSSLLRDWLVEQELPALSLCFARTENGKDA